MAKKKSAKSKGHRTPAPAGRRKSAGARTPKGKARKKQAAKPPRAGKARKAVTRAKSAKSAKSTRSARAVKAVKASRAAAPTRKRTGTAGRRGTRKAAPKRGGTGRERELDQTPETGRTVRGRTNPMPTKRSTGTPAGAGDTRTAPGLNRARRQLREVEESVQGPPSSLDMDRAPTAAASGRRRMKQAIEETNETGPVLTGGDVDADWGDAYAVGDEAPGGDNPTPDQDVVDEIGKALGVEYQDNEELKGAEKISERDKHRWELDPASSDDYLDRE